jgi:hypothetical protein
VAEDTILLEAEVFLGVRVEDLTAVQAAQHFNRLVFGADLETTVAKAEAQVLIQAVAVALVM